MGRCWRLMAVLLGVAFLASPVAAAEIKRFTDAQGVIRISNVPSRPVPVTPAVAAPEPKASGSAAMAPLPVVAAPSQTSLAGHVAGVAAGTPAANAASVSQPPPAVSPGEPPRPGAEAPREGAIPLKKVSWSPEDRVTAAPGVSAASAPRAGSDHAGAIRCFRDRQGIIHIANVASPETEALPATLPDQKRLAPAKLTVALPPGREEPSPQWPVQQVSWSPDAGPGPVQPASLNSRPTALAMLGAIRRYRDSRGVLHIENVPADIREAAPAPVREAKARPEGVRGSPGGLNLARAPAREEAGPEFLATGMAWYGGELASLDPAGWVPSAAALPDLAGPTGRRWRDQQGVCHLESVPLTAPPASPPPMIVAQPEAAESASPLLAALSPSEAQAAMAPSRSPALKPAGAQIVAFRDRQGKLVIRNPEPEMVIGRGPPPGWTATALDPIIMEAALSYRLPIPLVQAVIKVESNCVSWAVSPKGAMGLMQLMPGTATDLGVQDPFCPRQNVLAGCRYLRQLLNLFNDSLPLALAAYNAGYQRVVNAGYQVPPIKETQEFVTQVMGRYQVAAKQTRQPWI
jgi:soluble lytic murein transglycosylase-like protein